MEQALTIGQTGVTKSQETSRALILQTKREALLTRLHSFKTENMTAKEIVYYNVLRDGLSRLFIQLCWSKLGVSLEQLQKLEQDDLNELAAIIYERSKIPSFIQTGILLCIPLFGWLILAVTITGEGSARMMDKINYGKDAQYKNNRYCYWYKKIRTLSGKNFCPDLKIQER